MGQYQSHWRVIFVDSFKEDKWNTIESDKKRYKTWHKVNNLLIKVLKRRNIFVNELPIKVKFQRLGLSEGSKLEAGRNDVYFLPKSLFNDTLGRFGVETQQCLYRYPADAVIHYFRQTWKCLHIRQWITAGCAGISSRVKYWIWSNATSYLHMSYQDKHENVCTSDSGLPLDVQT